jgi:putative ABC transport system permease protein
VLAVAVLALLFTLSAGERKAEFGVYRALGATRRKLAALILLEASVTSGVGALTGAALCALVFFSFNPLLSLSIQMPYLEPSARALAALFGSGFLLAFFAGPLASLYPALKIGRQAVFAVMREAM